MANPVTQPFSIILVDELSVFEKFGFHHYCFAARPVDRPGSQKRHVMLSGRFNDDKTKAYMKKVKVALEQLNIDVFMVEKGIGEEYAAPTMLGMYNAKAMVIFGTAEYGAKTGVQYETYFELQYAYQEKIFLIPLRLCKEWPPKPTDADGGHLGAAQNSFVLRPSIIRAEDIKMENPREMAKKIAEAVRQHDTSQEEEEAIDPIEMFCFHHMGPGNWSGQGYCSLHVGSLMQGFVLYVKTRPFSMFQIRCCCPFSVLSLLCFALDLDINCSVLISHAALPVLVQAKGRSKQQAR